MNRKNISALLKHTLLVLALGFSAGSQADTTSTSSSKSTHPLAVQPTATAPLKSYNTAYPGPQYGRPYYPLNRQRFNSRNDHRFNGRNDWFGDNRMHHWNRVVNDMVSDMFGDAAGDFEFDMKIKFKADGKGKGRGKAGARNYTDTRTQHYYQCYSQGRGNYYGSGHSSQYSNYGGYGYGPYSAPYSPYYRYQRPTTYPSYPPISTPRTQQPENKKKTAK